MSSVGSTASETDSFSTIEVFEGDARFEPLRMLGQGASGRVYEAIDHETGERVAIKVLHASSPVALSRFKNEFRALQDLHHPNLVGYRGFHEVGGQWFITMELLEGMDFLEWVRPAGQDYDEERLRQGLAQLTLGLRELHRWGRVHRDVKPSNIRVTSQGRVVLVDFGLVIARAEDTLDGPARIVGTVGYMAPEQAVSRQVGPASDWYALGSVLYRCLTGHLPFHGVPFDVIARKLSTAGPDPRKRAPHVPAELAELCTALMKPEPDQRLTGNQVAARLGVVNDRLVSQVTIPPTLPADAPFVGRRSELDRLARALPDRPTSGLKAVVLRGQSGIGKSALLQRFVEESRARHPNLVVLQGRCYEGENVPYKAVDGIIDALSRFLGRLDPQERAALLPRGAPLLARVFPVLRRLEELSVATVDLDQVSSGGQLREQAFRTLRRLLRRIGVRYRLLTVIDDLQWADADSLALLSVLLRAPRQPNMTLVVAERVDPRAPAAGEQLSRLIAQLEARTLNLGPMRADELRRLAGMLLQREGEPRPEPAEQVAREADGFPLFVYELVSHVLESPTSDVRAARLDEALRVRVARLDGAPRGVLLLAAFAGRPIRRNTLAAASGLPPATLSRALSFLTVARLIRTAGRRATDLVSVYHDRVRSAVAQLVSEHAEDGRALHRQLAMAYETEGSEEHHLLSVHWEGAGELARAANHAMLAGDQAGHALAFDRAAEEYGRVVALGGGGREPVDLHTRWAHALAAAGRGPAAAAIYQRAAEQSPPGPDAARLSRWAAEQLLRAGRIDEGLAILGAQDDVPIATANQPVRAMLALVRSRARLQWRGSQFELREEETIAPEVLAKLDLWWSVASVLSMGDTLRGAELHARNLKLALDVGEPKRLALALVTESCFAAGLGGRYTARALKAGALASQLAGRSGDPRAIALARGAEAIGAYMAGHWRPAAALFDEVVEQLQEQCIGAWWEVGTATIFAHFARWWGGDVAGLSESVPVDARRALDRGDNYSAVALCTGMLNSAWLLTGDVDGAEAIHREVMSGWSHTAFDLRSYWDLCGTAQRHLYRGNVTLAWQLMRERWPLLRRSQLLRVRILFTEAWDLRARAALAVASRPGPHRKRALADARAAIRRLERQPFGVAHALGLLRRAELVSLSGADAEVVADAFRLARRSFRELKMKLFLQVARYGEGRWRGGAAGAARMAEVEDWMLAQGVVEPSNILAMLGPVAATVDATTAG